MSRFVLQIGAVPVTMSAQDDVSDIGRVKKFFWTTDVTVVHLIIGFIFAAAINFLIAQWTAEKSAKLQTVERAIEHSEGFIVQARKFNLSLSSGPLEAKIPRENFIVHLGEQYGLVQRVPAFGSDQILAKTNYLKSLAELSDAADKLKDVTEPFLVKSFVEALSKAEYSKEEFAKSFQ